MYEGFVETTVLMSAQDPAELSSKIIDFHNYCQILKGEVVPSKLENNDYDLYRIKLLVFSTELRLGKFLQIRSAIKSHLEKNYHIERFRIITQHSDINSYSSSSCQGIFVEFDANKTLLENTTLRTQHRRSWNLTKDPNIVTIEINVDTQLNEFLKDTLNDIIKQPYVLPNQKLKYNYIEMDSNPSIDKPWLTRYA